MENPSKTNPGNDDSRINHHQHPPALSTNTKVSDPVRHQRKIDRIVFKKPMEVIPEKDSTISTKIMPSLHTRIDLQQFDVPPHKVKYLPKKSKKQQKFFEKNRANTAKKFCKYSTIKEADPIPSKKLEPQFNIPSPEPSSAKVLPRRVTPTSSWLHPEAPTSAELALKRPKSGILINEILDADGEDGGGKPYDSFDLVYRRRPRPHSKRKGTPADRRRPKKKGKKKLSREKSKSGLQLFPDDQYLELLEKQIENEIAMGEYDDGDYDLYHDYLTKQFRRKVSMMSNSTSYQSKDIMSSDSVLHLSRPFHVDRYAQKFRRDSEIKRFEPKKRKFKRGTLESHSFTNIYQPILKNFYFGSKQGTMHQANEHFAGNVRNMQGICIPIAAYCYTYLKHPNRWTSENIDEILDAGSQLYQRCLEALHVHRAGKELKPDDLEKYCFIKDKKIRFTVDEPEVSGLIKSTDRTVFNLTKGLNIFFARQKAGILQTQDTNLLFWKDKYFYFFDGKPRTKDLYYAPNGMASMANFYDIPAIVTILLQRSGLQNWPFVIYPIKVYKVLAKDDDDPDEKEFGLETRSNFNILNENKAILIGSYDLGDKCFGFTRNKQSLPMAVVCLVYSRITPPSAWHRQTLDKIMIIGNQLYLECMECESINELKLNTIPAFFTVGPYIVEIYIYANRIVDLMYEKCNCQLKCCLEEFFRTNTNAILQIGTCHLAVWKQRNMYFCFDPYSRGTEVAYCYKCREGYACLSMHTNINSIVDLVTHNFDDHDTIFNLHALKVCKINRDPIQTEHFPKHTPLEEFSLEEIKSYKMRKSRKPATEKPVTVDYTALAMRSLLMGQSPDPSLLEIGSTVESLGLDQLPNMAAFGAGGDRPSLRKLNISIPKPTSDIVADLDSPSLSDTQIIPQRPIQPKDDLSIQFLDIDSFELTQDEIELETSYAGEGDTMDKYEGRDDVEDLEVEEMKLIKQAEEDAEMEYQDVDDFYYAQDRFAQVRAESLVPITVSEEINTDLTFFPIKKEILYPTYIRSKQQMRMPSSSLPQKFHKDDWREMDDFIPMEPTVTKSEELLKETNFIGLPDDSQIIRGTKNLLDYGDEVEIMAPFVCIMADIVAKKYSILSWSEDIIDYVLKCGVELFNISKFRYDQLSKLEIPQISLGKTKFKCLVEYVFDSYIRQNILELAINKILFVRSDMGVLVTPTYACALIYKNHLYYMYDGFGCNEVGLNEEALTDGTACFCRFKDLRSLVTRIMYNKRKRETREGVVYTKFVLSLVKVKMLRHSEIKLLAKKKVMKSKTTEERDDEGDEVEMADQYGEDDGANLDIAPAQENVREVKRKRGYRYKNGLLVIEGTRSIQPASQAGGADDMDATRMLAKLNADHFASLCACLMLLHRPVEKWDSKNVDEALDHGIHIYSHADDLEISEKRTIKNVLIGKNFFDIIVKNIKIVNPKDNRNLTTGIDTLLRRKRKYFLVQCPDKCYVIHNTISDGKFHIFYPCGLPQRKNQQNGNDNNNNGALNAGWLRCENLKEVKQRLNQAVAGNIPYDFYTFEVTSIRKSPKDMLINYRINQYSIDRPEKSEHFGKPFYEDSDWLKADPIPWSRLVDKTADGKERNILSSLWNNNWTIEYENDLYSLVSNINQDSDKFSENSRGKQTLCNLITCIGMLQIYDFSEWNSAVLDSILVNGDQYFHECFDNIQEENYELSLDDLKEDCVIFPFTFKVALKPIVEGTMFLVRNTQFNLYKAIRFFFDQHERRSGIICCTKSDTNRKHVAFGKTRHNEYYLFDCDCRGGLMFLEGHECAFILRATSLNRLIHILTMNLRGGDFFIYDVVVSDLQSVS